jgi:hypothetical protein
MCDIFAPAVFDVKTLCLVVLHNVISWFNLLVDGIRERCRSNCQALDIQSLCTENLVKGKGKAISIRGLDRP